MLSLVLTTFNNNINKVKSIKKTDRPNKYGFDFAKTIILVISGELVGVITGRG
jgi:hypothetical protein